MKITFKGRQVMVLWIVVGYAFFAHGAGDRLVGEKKAVVCAACHGKNGISLTGVWPNLAGQHVTYLVKQLQAFKEKKTRDSAVMAPWAAGLTDQDMQDLAAFYHCQAVAKEPPAPAAKKGEVLYRGGNYEKHIAACIACHGPDGMGNAAASFPMLAGQKAEYTVLQLQQFKEGKRQNDLNAIMRDISARMNQEEMEAVAHYLAGLRGNPAH